VTLILCFNILNKTCGEKIGKIMLKSAKYICSVDVCYMYLL